MSRYGGPRSLASLLPALTRPAIGKQGFSEAGLFTDWSAIAGEEIAAYCQPERLDFPRGQRREGVLKLRVESAWATALQHLEPQLIERVNASLGYRAVARLKLIQGPIARPPQRRGPTPPAPRPIDPAALKALAEETATIEDEGLRAAVERLALALLAHGPPGK
jgi:hypothetical protein